MVDHAYEARAVRLYKRFKTKPFTAKEAAIELNVHVPTMRSWLNRYLGALVDRVGWGKYRARARLRLPHRAPRPRKVTRADSRSERLRTLIDDTERAFYTVGQGPFKTCAGCDGKGCLEDVEFAIVIKCPVCQGSGQTNRRKR